jgi:two-component system OmpR family sensor kinase
VKLRRQLVITMIILVAVGLAAVNIITLTSLHSFLYGRVDDQLNGASQQMASFVARADQKNFTVTQAAIGSHVSPDLYVELIDPSGHVVVARPSDTEGSTDPAPELPAPLNVNAAPGRDTTPHPEAYRPLTGDIDVNSVGGHGPVYRMEASSIPGYTLVVASSLATVTATLNSLRNIELAVSLGLLAALLILMTLLIRQGLRPLEDMAKEADAIAAGDLSRRVQPTEGDSEIARLGRALNGMLAQIETAFSQRARSEVFCPTPPMNFARR